MPITTIPLDERFWKRVDKRGECWEWTGPIRAITGYGSFDFSKSEKPKLAHRLSWELTYGEIPPEKLVCHTCDNRKCVRPDHLWLGSQSDNQRDAVAKGRHSQSKKTHCPQGHPYDEENTYIYPRGGRLCRSCHRQQQRTRYTRISERDR